MSILNTSLCAVNGANTGVADCPVDVKLIQGIIEVPKSFVLDETDLLSTAAVMAKINAAIKADNPALRAYPFPPQVTLTDNSTDPAFQTFGSGSGIPANDGMYDWMFQFTKGGLCLSNALRKRNSNANRYFLAYDANGNLYGTKVGNTLKGIPANYIYADKFKAATYTEVSVYAYRVNFRPNYFNENVAFVALDLAELLELTGLQNIVPSLVAPRTTNTFTIKLTTGCGGTDLYDQYADDLADPSLFKVTENGLDITITSVAKVANSKGFLFTLNASDPDYDADGPFVLTGSTVTALDGAGVVGFEIQRLDIA